MRQNEESRLIFSLASPLPAQYLKWSTMHSIVGRDGVTQLYHLGVSLLFRPQRDPAKSKSTRPFIWKPHMIGRVDFDLAGGGDMSILEIERIVNFL